MTVKRYSPCIETDHHGLCDVPSMREDSTGNWVRYADYTADTFRAAVETAEASLQAPTP